MAKERSTNFIGAGKLPPQDVPMEEIVIGTLLLHPASITTIIELLKPEIFYRNSNQIICDAILSLYNANKKIDIAIITALLRQRGELEIIGGAYELTMLTERVASDSHLHDHIRIVYQMYLLREQIRFFTEKINQCYELTDPFNVIADTTRFMDHLQAGVMTKSEIHVSELSMKAIKDRESNVKPKLSLGISTGTQTLNKGISGFQNGQLIIIAARPAMGKTAFALSIVKSIGFNNRLPVAIFSLEMTAEQLYTRMQASVSEIDSHKIKLNTLNEQERILINNVDGDFSNCPIYIDETPALNIDLFRAKATIMKHKYGIQAIVIDYLQLMKGNNKNSFNREAEVSEISGKLKQVAKELNIPVIALSQLSREVEKRAGGNKIPQLSDLRDSGSIEQDADVVLFLYRPSYYEVMGTTGFKHFNMEILAKNLLCVIIAKQREGETYMIPLHINLAIMKIMDHPALEQYSQPTNQLLIGEDKPNNFIIRPSNMNDDAEAPF